MRDFWNWIDIASMVINGVFLIGMDVGLFSDEPNGMLTMENLRAFGAIAVFLLWIKTFYWMRLFKNLASFITLITQTLWDIRTFSIMVFLIICAFANFFYIINKNTFYSGDGADAFRYIVDYTQTPVSNALMDMYFIALGEFASMANYSKGHNSIIAWIMFILATLIMLVVFMNMLIAIMGDTFGNVQSTQEENSLFE